MIYFHEEYRNNDQELKPKWDFLVLEYPTWAPKPGLSWTGRIETSIVDVAYGMVWEKIFWSQMATSSTIVILLKLALHKGQVEVFLLEVYMQNN